MTNPLALTDILALPLQSGVSGTGSDPDVPVMQAWGDYDQLAKVGEGGMGVVYKARHARLHRFEAVKVMRAGRFANPKEFERFKFEAEATAALEHSNIVPVYGVGEVSGLPYFAMKWIDGGSLAEKAKDLRANPKALASLMAKIARAVHHAHRQGILHRDLKPSNILLDADGEPHVTDFGLAKQFGDADDPAKSGLTMTGAVVGTPAYMAPEQAKGSKGITTAADVYGLGAILYELLTARPPFEGDSLAMVLRKVVTDSPADPHLLNPNVDRELEAICLHCLEKDPADRYPSAAAVAEDLDRFVAGQAITVHSTTVREWVRQVMRQRPDSFEGYAWEVKLWFGLIMAVAQPTIFTLVLADVGIEWVWAVFFAAWAVGWVVVQRHMGAKFSRLPETEKHSMMIAVGHIIANVALTFAYVPIHGPAERVLAVYPAQAVCSGLALFVIGTTHWGRFFLVGLAVMALAPLLVLWPIAGPLAYGAALAGSMWYWAYAVKVTFGRGNSPQARVN